MTVLAAVAVVPTELKSALLWQPIPVDAQPVFAAVLCAAEFASVWIASAPVWHAEHADVESFALQLLLTAVVAAALLWQFRHTFVPFVLFTEVLSECSSVRLALLLRMSWQEPHGVP